MPITRSQREKQGDNIEEVSCERSTRPVEETAPTLIQESFCSGTDRNTNMSAPADISDVMTKNIANVGDTILNESDDEASSSPSHSPIANSENKSKDEELLQMRLEILKLQRKICSLEETNTHEDPPGMKTSIATTSPPFSGTITSQANESDISKLASVIIAATKNTMCKHSLDLPKYNGSHGEWLAFQAAYMQTARHVTDVENMARLRRCLVGKAKEAVKNLLIYQSDPLEIMKSLESRFGRPDAIAITELETLKNLPKPGTTPRDLCMFTTRFCNILCSLEALGKIFYLYNPEITRSTVEKLSPTLQHRFFAYAAQQPKQEADLLKLKRFLCIEAENCAPFARPESNFESEKPQIKFQRAYVTEVKEKRKICIVCEKDSHTVNKCLVFKERSIDERWALAKEKSLCFRCLKPRTKNHRCPINRCNINECQRRHHPLLHPNEERNSSPTVEIVANASSTSAHRVYLKIIPVCVQGKNKSVNTFALLDDGSSVTLIDEELARTIEAEGPIEPLRIEGITSDGMNQTTSRRISIALSTKHNQISNIQGRTMKNLKLSPQTVLKRNISECEHLCDIIDEVCYSHAIPEILIGQDNWHLLISSETRKGARQQPVASLTQLGWVLHGSHTRSLGQKVHHVVDFNSSDNRMDEQLKQFFAIDSLTIMPKRPYNDPEDMALNQLKQHTRQREDGYFETTLIWRNDNKPEMPENYETALKRLRGIEKKLDRDPLLKSKYGEQMQALIDKGYAERAPLERNALTWYLPHFAVVNKMKPEKIRIVHDAAAKTRGVSLNDNLLKGPDLLQSLPGILMRFRQHKVAVTADIQEMFMQIKIREQDRDALRYLWRGEEREKEPTEYRMTSLVFGATSSPATAIFVKNYNAERFRDTDPEAAAAIERNHYMDDFLQSFKTTKEATVISKKVLEIHSKANFVLRQWNSNSKEVLKSLGVEDLQSNFKIDDGSKMERVLGLIWRPQEDTLNFNLSLVRLPNGILNEPEPTKRHVLKILMSIFDPLGFASPVTSRGKQIFQEIWRTSAGWDEKINQELAEQWHGWMKNLQCLGQLKIPRCYIKYSEAKSLQLHVFVDASELAYAAVLYWRTVNAEGQRSLTLIQAKARVAPLKMISIPRLELQAAVMGSRMASATLEEHDIKPEAKFFWTDSKTVLTWLKTGARSYKPFVAHRIASVQENTSLSEWRWVPTSLNVADDATRDVPKCFDSKHRWIAGPEFLLQDESYWPKDSILSNKPTGEERIHTVVIKGKSRLLECFPDVKRFSDWERLVRTVARVLQFIDLCTKGKEKVWHKRFAKNRTSDPEWRVTCKKNKKSNSIEKRQPSNTTCYEILNAQLIIRAENLLMRAVQENSFSDDLITLASGKTITAQSRLKKLAVELVNGEIRIKSRINAAVNIDDEVKNPIVLDGDDYIVRLYIAHIHKILHHAGVEATINECRQRYFILRLRPTTRMIIRRCPMCQIRKALPSVPPTGNHLENRLAHHQRPFTFVGVDYFGPMTVTIGRSTQKRYIALFTCLTTRAIHLELAGSLSTDSAIMALRRMIARRGCPDEIWSDNGTNLRGASRELYKLINRATQEEAARKKVKWRFIPPGAPFMGGAWERLIRSVKNALTNTLHEKSPREEVLSTVLAEIEYTVNSRPLTHV
ncbi:unnamed protein product [Leptosia nina]|uniref:Integrase catalytic domain-containing protein n=1 Tax=Leptosia nina TaxID=320188 RepID=A0AAV1JUF1_9NEOP